MISKHTVANQLRSDIDQLIRHISCQSSCCSTRVSTADDMNQPVTIDKNISDLVPTNPLFQIDSELNRKIKDGSLADQGIQIMLRDLLLWSLITDRIDMAKVFLLHIKPRICAALLCVAVLRNYVYDTKTIENRHMYEQKAEEFEIYAADCVDQCFKKNERRACELLIREIPLFGNISCMQVSTSYHFYRSNKIIFTT